MTADDDGDRDWELVPKRQDAGGVPLPWPWKSWALPVMLASIYWLWWDAGAREFTRAAGGAVPPGPLRAGLWMALGSKLLSHALEASWYSLVWRGRGFRIGILRLFTWVAALSLLDIVALWILRAAAGAHGAALALAAVLAGPGALGEDSPLASAGVRAAFGGAGLLAGVRIAGMAYTQSRALRRAFAGPLVLTAATWLASRVAIAWVTELLQGRSPLP